MGCCHYPALLGQEKLKIQRVWFLLTVYCFCAIVGQGPCVTYRVSPPLTIVLVCLLARERLLAANIPEAEHLKENAFEFTNWKESFLGDNNSRNTSDVRLKSKEQDESKLMQHRTQCAPIDSIKAGSTRSAVHRPEKAAVFQVGNPLFCARTAEGHFLLL